MTTTNSADETLSSYLAAANGRRRQRTADLGDLQTLVFDLLVAGGEPRHTPRVANSYGYAAVGTYAAAARKTSGEVVVGVWVEPANRAGRLIGVDPALRRADRVQAAVDGLTACEFDPTRNGTAGGRLVLTAEEAAEFAADDAGEAALLRAVAAAPSDDTPRLVLADYLDDAGKGWLAERVRKAVARDAALVAVAAAGESP